MEKGKYIMILEEQRKMNKEFFEALSLLEQEKHISTDYLLEKIRNALVIAVKRNFAGSENVVVDINPDKNIIDVYIRKTVVEEVTDPATDLRADDVEFPVVGIVRDLGRPEPEQHRVVGERDRLIRRQDGAAGLPMDQVRAVPDRKPREILEGRIDQVEILPDPTDARIRAESRQDGVTVLRGGVERGRLRLVPERRKHRVIHF